jgi:hypothetical protein
MITSKSVKEALELLNIHHEAFWRAAPHASKTGHPVPSDTRGWSQIIVSALTEVKGMERKKGPDLVDGSDVKAANTWEAIDTPRFNGVLKAGTKSKHSGKISFLDDVPHIFFALWDIDARETHRFRLWVVRTNQDKVFRKLALRWYEAVERGTILKEQNQKLTRGVDVGSWNFQLHPPRGRDSNMFSNTLGNLEYPLLFQADATDKIEGKYKQVFLEASVLTTGACKEAP